MLQNRLRSQEGRKAFTDYLNRFTEGIDEKRRSPGRPKNQKHKCLSIEAPEFSGEFLVQSAQIIQTVQRDVIECLERAAEPLAQSWDQDQINNLLQSLSKLGKSPRWILEVGYLECSDYLKTILSELHPKTPFLKLVQNLSPCIRRLEKSAKAYTQYIEDTRAVLRENKQISFSDLVEEFNKEIKLEICPDKMQQILAEVESGLFSRLLRSYLKEVNIASTEVCRLCQKSMSMKHLYTHVDLCQKRFEVTKKLQDNCSTSQLFLERIRKKELEIIAKKKRASGSREGELANLSQIEKLQVELYRRMAKLLDGHLGRKRAIVQSNDTILFAEISKIVNYLKCIKEIHDNYNRFCELITDRHNLKQRLKKIEIQFQKFEEDETIATVKSVNSERQEFRDGHFINNRFNNSIKLIEIQDKPHDTQRKRLRKMNTYAQPIPSLTELSHCEKNYYSERNMREFFDQVNIIKLKDFEILKFLGKGAFGRVYLVRRKATDDLYAMKMVKLDHTIDSCKLSDIVNELDILRKISGDYFVKAAFSFTKGSAHLFFLEYMAGGDLASLLDREVYLSENLAKFYIAEIVLALENLHALNIIHRDLKPQNLVFDNEGHLKLTDFGLSKASIDIMLEAQTTLQYLNYKEGHQGKPACFSNKKDLLGQPQPSRIRGHIIGTPDYIPPEIVRKVSSQNPTIDWWSLGVIVYEILIGQKPFGSQSIEGVFDNILNLRLEWPNIGYEQGMITPEAQNLIQRFLQPDPNKRLGVNGANQIKQHPFFNGIEWNNLRYMKPPLQAKITSTSNIIDEDLELRTEVQNATKDVIVDRAELKNLHVDNLFRSDLLSAETIRSGGRKQTQMALFNNIAMKCGVYDDFRGDIY